MDHSGELVEEEDSCTTKGSNWSAAVTGFTWQPKGKDKDAVYEEMEVNELQWEDPEDDTPPSLTHNCESEGCLYGGPGVLPVHVSETDNHQSQREEFGGLIKRRRPKVQRIASPFDALSDETMLRIFGFLKRPALCKCASVCKEWKRLCYDESLWVSVNMSELQLKSKGTIGNVLERGVKVLRLAKSQVYGAIFTSDPQRRRGSRRQGRVLNGLLSLEYVDASLCKFHDGTLGELLQKCQRLKKLSLEGCHLTEADMRGIMNNKNLETLNLCMCTGVTSSGIEGIAQNCFRLSSLNISWTDMETKAVYKVCTKFPSLVALNISGYRMDMNDAALKAILVSSPLIKHLDVSDSPLLGSESLAMIVKRSKLETLAISRCFGIPPNDICTLADLNSLKELQIYGFLNNAGLGHLAQLRPNMLVNANMLSTIARPCSSGKYKGKIWGVACHKN